MAKKKWWNKKYCKAPQKHSLKDNVFVKKDREICDEILLNTNGSSSLLRTNVRLANSYNYLAYEDFDNHSGDIWHKSTQAFKWNNKKAAGRD